MGAFYGWLGPALGQYGQGYDAQKKKQQDAAEAALRQQTASEQLKQMMLENPLKIAAMKDDAAFNAMYRPKQLEGMDLGNQGKLLENTQRQNANQEWTNNADVRSAQHDLALKNAAIEDKLLQVKQSIPEGVQKDAMIADLMKQKFENQKNQASAQSMLENAASERMNAFTNRQNVGLSAQRFKSEQELHDIEIQEKKKKLADAKSQDDLSQQLLDAQENADNYANQPNEKDVNKDTLEALDSEVDRIRNKLMAPAFAKDPAGYNNKTSNAQLRELKINALKNPVVKGMTPQELKPRFDHANELAKMMLDEKTSSKAIEEADKLLVKHLPPTVVQGLSVQEKALYTSYLEYAMSDPREMEKVKNSLLELSREKQKTQDAQSITSDLIESVYKNAQKETEDNFEKQGYKPKVKPMGRMTHW